MIRKDRRDDCAPARVGAVGADHYLSVLRPRPIEVVALTHARRASAADALLAHIAFTTRDLGYWRRRKALQCAVEGDGLIHYSGSTCFTDGQIGVSPAHTGLTQDLAPAQVSHGARDSVYKAVLTT